MKQLTKQEIREKAIEFIENNKDVNQLGEWIRVIELDLVKFAESLFKETEHETWARIVQGCSADDSHYDLAKLYHEERKRIENE